MNTPYFKAEATTKKFSEISGGKQFYGIRNATFGPISDLCECLFNIHGIKTSPARILERIIKKNLREKEGPINVYGHSQGVIHMKNALAGFDEESRARINAYGFAPAGRLEEGSCRKIVNYASRRDFVPLIDPMINGWKNCSSLTILDPHPEAEFFDHSIDSLTLEPYLRKELE
jgi:hypothetical protein